MAELDTSGGGKKGKKVRSKKQSTRVDLTAMVDLAFLLITFFMLTTSLSKPIAMDIAKPDKNELHPENQTPLPASRTMTILLGKNDKVAWYMGLAKDAVPNIQSLSQMRSVLIEYKKKVSDANNNDPEKGLIVVVKPTSGSKYHNFVDIMDELEIAKIDYRSIDDDNILAGEKELMKNSGIL